MQMDDPLSDIHRVPSVTSLTEWHLENVSHLITHLTRTTSPLTRHVLEAFVTHFVTSRMDAQQVSDHLEGCGCEVERVMWLRHCCNLVGQQLQVFFNQSSLELLRQRSIALRLDPG